MVRRRAPHRAPGSPPPTPLQRNLTRDVVVVVGAATLSVVAFATVQHRVVLGLALDLQRLLVPACVGLGFGGILAQLLQQRAAQCQLSEALTAREAEVLRLNRSLERLVEERTAALRAAQAELAEREKMDALGRLAGGVAHDMNNVLTAIRASTSLAREEPEEVEAYLDEVDAACERTARLTGQLLATARDQAGTPRTLDLGSELERQLPYLRRVVGDGVRITLDPGAPELHIFMDRGHLEQVLQNLAANARDAMGGTGTLRLAASGEADRVVLRVHDSGPGVPLALRPRIFEPFYTTKPTGEGTGLGLSVTHGIVAQAGGEIAIADVPEGCCFRIRVPRARPDAISPRSP